MFRKILVCTSSALVLSGCFVSTRTAEVAPEPLPAPAPENRSDSHEYITVTGSRIRRDSFTSTAPVQVIDSEEVRDAGLVDMSRYSVAQGVREPGGDSVGAPRASGDPGRESYEVVDPNPVLSTLEQPVSTFSIDVDTASYTVVRDYLRSGYMPPAEAVRPEELINYFDYAYPQPEDESAPFAADVHVTPNPWNAETQLLHVGIQGLDLVEEERPPVNLVYLIDVSGSMNSPDKLPLAVETLNLLVDQMQPNDRIGIVVYAGAAGVVLEPTQARDAHVIRRALGQLRAGGSTAGGAGLAAAYALAEENFDPDALNRVILMTDGDFNVGTTNNERLEDFVARKRETGIYLSVFGFGSGNYQDDRMQAIAQAGNGVAGYIDSRQEARRLMVDQVASTLFTIAEDVKIQLEFNPARVAEYRLIGYETRALNREDFNNDAVDAGEIGAGHSVTAIYEIAGPEAPGRRLDPLRYAGNATADDAFADEYGLLRIRYKQPGGEESELIERPITVADQVDSLAEAPADVEFSICVAGFAQLLRQDRQVDDAFTFQTIFAALDEGRGEDRWGYRADFREMVYAAAHIDAEASSAEAKP